MRAVVQKVSQSKVTVENEITGEIGQGLMVLLGVTHEDTEADAKYMAEKIANLRIFEDAITFEIALMVVKYMKYMETLEY